MRPIVGLPLNFYLRPVLRILSVLPRVRLLHAMTATLFFHAAVLGS
jgi:hypothetical protein